MRYFITIGMLLIFSIGICFSQNEKYEREFRIKKNEAPSMSVHFIDSVFANHKIKWYKEVGLLDTSYEAKTKYHKKLLSIEFSKDGVFEDLEVTSNINEIPLPTQKKIHEYFSLMHPKYSIQKFQVQYSGDQYRVFEYYVNTKNSQGIITQYEIIISTKNNGVYVLLEYLFSENGEYISNKLIKTKFTDNIEY